MHAPKPPPTLRHIPYLLYYHTLDQNPVVRRHQGKPAQAVEFMEELTQQIPTFSPKETQSRLLSCLMRHLQTSYLASCTERGHYLWHPAHKYPRSAFQILGTMDLSLKPIKCPSSSVNHQTIHKKERDSLLLSLYCLHAARSGAICTSLNILITRAISHQPENQRPL